MIVDARDDISDMLRPRCPQEHAGGAGHGGQPRRPGHQGGLQETSPTQLGLFRPQSLDPLSGIIGMVGDGESDAPQAGGAVRTSLVTCYFEKLRRQ